MAYCAVAFSLASCFTAILRRTLSLFSVMFFRLAIAWLLMICTLRYKGLMPFDATFFKRAILVRSGLNIVAVVLEIFVLSRLSLTNATVLMYTHPLFAAALGALCLGEAFGYKQVALLVLAFTGVVINAQPWSDISDNSDSSRSMMAEPLAICAGFLFAVVVAALFVWIRLKLQDEPALIVVHHYLLIGAFFAFMIAVADDSGFIAQAVKTRESCLLLIAIGVLVVSGEVAGNMAVQQGSVGPVVAVRNVDIVLVFLWQPLMTDEPVTVVGGLGAMVILVATTLLVFVSANGVDHEVNEEPVQDYDDNCTNLEVVPLGKVTRERSASKEKFAFAD